MGKLRFLLALWLAKLSVPALKITRHNGTDFPGSLALKLCPDFLRYVGKPGTIIAVTGTNGKTTVSNLLTDILEADGKKVLSNRSGSNITSGISTALLRGCDLLGRAKPYDMAVLEVDERASVRIFPYVKPDYVVVTNLTRDSIMRNAHPGYIADILTRSIPQTATMILNADDLITCGVAPENRRVYFGVDRLPGDTTRCENLIDDLRICPKCSGKLTYVSPVSPHRQVRLPGLRVPLPGERLSGHGRGHGEGDYGPAGGRGGASLPAYLRQCAEPVQHGDGHCRAAAAGIQPRGH